MEALRFRQVHLDFHTSGLIPDIGARFSREQFADALRRGHVDSITLFSKCHHGYSYHPTEANEIHPGLSFDLLGEQIEVCRSLGVRAPVYLSAGVDEKEAVRHAEWLLKPSPDAGADFVNRAGYHVPVSYTHLDVYKRQAPLRFQRYAERFKKTHRILRGKARKGGIEKLMSAGDIFEQDVYKRQVLFSVPA